MIKNWIAAGAAMTGLVCTGAAARPLLTIAGDTTGAPTFNRATTGTFEPGDFVALSGIGTAVPFVTIRFVVTAGGTVRLETVAPSAYDTTLFLYSDFDPSDPLANGIDADGDSGGKKTWLSLINTVLVPGNGVEAEITGRAAAEREGKTFVSPYSDLEIIAGQGTVGLELAAQCADLAAVYVCVGGGGLISGIGSYLKALRPEVEIIGCWPANATAMHLCLERGESYDTPQTETLSEG